MQVPSISEMLVPVLRPWDKGQQRDLPEGLKLRAAGCLMEGSAAANSIYAFPPPLPSCHLDLQFTENEQQVAVPPAFYTGNTIPTLVTLIIGRPTCLSHSLNPRLVMAMTGTLTYGSEVRTIISVSVSLAQGLVLWTHDAVRAHRRQSPLAIAPHCNPAVALPGGRYSLPLTVSIPNIKLPPTYDTKDGRFSVRYHLSISLLCDDPYGLGEAIVLSEVSKPFVMLPINARLAVAAPAKPCATWTAAPTLPTSAFSPTSVVPVTIAFKSPPDAPGTNVLVRLSIVHRQLIGHSFPASQRDRAESVLSERVLRQRQGVFHVMGGGRTTVLHDMSLPLLFGGGGSAGSGIWEHGLSSTVILPADPLAAEPIETELTAGFLVRVELRWLGSRLGGLETMPLNRLSRVSTHAIPLAIAESHSLCTETRDYPFVVGSVSEPRDALHYMKWNDLCIQQDTVNGQSVERAHLLHGGDYSSENGWIVAPPSYNEALEGSTSLQPGYLLKEDIRIEVDSDWHEERTQDD